MEEINILEEPAFLYKNVLSKEAYKLLNKLILDLKSKMPTEDRIYRKKDNPSLIYNLFCGKYEFNYKRFKEIFNCISTDGGLEKNNK